MCIVLSSLLISICEVSWIFGLSHLQAKSELRCLKKFNTESHDMQCVTICYADCLARRKITSP